MRGGSVGSNGGEGSEGSVLARGGGVSSLGRY